MSKSEFVSDAVREYVQRFGVREHPALARCRRETDAMGDISRMQISPEQGALMAVLTRATAARRAIEVGVFTGYSSAAVALALKAMHGGDAELLALDLSADYMARARDYWTEAGVADIIHPVLGPASDSLDSLIAQGRAGQFDMAFIDADKAGYDTYYEGCLRVVRPGGLIAIDNVLWSGRVADPDDADENTRHLRTLNEKVAADERVDHVLLPLADGLTLARRR